MPAPRSPGAPLPGSVCSAALPVAGVPPPPPPHPVSRVSPPRRGRQMAPAVQDWAPRRTRGSGPPPARPGPGRKAGSPPPRPGLPSRACLGCPFAGLGGGAAPPGHPRVGVGAPTRGRSSRAAPPQPLGTVWVFLGGECSSPLSPIRCQPWLPGASPPPQTRPRGAGGPLHTWQRGLPPCVPPPPPSLPRASPPARDKLFFHPTSAPAAVTRGRPRRGGGAEKPTPRASAKAGCAGQS